MRAQAFLEALGLGELITRTRATKVELHCPAPEHHDRRPSAATFEDSLVTVCHACGRTWSPWALALERGLTRREAVELCIRFGVREERRPDVSELVPSRPRPALERKPFVPAPAAELSPELLERLAVAAFERRRYDDRLAELRGLASDVLDAAGVGIGRARGYGFRGPSAALDELRLLVPGRDSAARTVGLLAIAPNPGRRAEPKLLALPGAARTLLELVPVAEPLERVLVVAEGELDALAAASAGISAVGVPGVGTFARHAARIAWLVRTHELEHALLIPDGDRAGRSSFRDLAAAIAAAGAPAVLADVLEDGADVGSELVTIAAAAAGDAGERRRAAGRALLSRTRDTGGSP